MKYNDFTRLIAKEINQYCYINSGSIGTGYLYILIIVDGRIVKVGELVYRLWQNSELTDVKLLTELGQEVQKYIDGTRKTIPVLCWVEDKLQVTHVGDKFLK